MAKANDDSNDSQSVTHFIEKLEPLLGETVKAIRQIILSTSPLIGERIKWNHPSFFYLGQLLPFNPKEYKRDIAVFNLHKGRIMLVLPSGAKLNHASGLLEGDYTDGRRTITFKNVADVISKEQLLLEVIKEWISLVDKA
jgi:hypothetical protein